MKEHTNVMFSALSHPLLNSRYMQRDSKGAMTIIKVVAVEQNGNGNVTSTSEGKSIFRAPSSYLPLLRQVCAEMVGTFLMTFSICAVVAVGKLIPGGIGLMEYAATGALAVMVVIFSIGHISGAHVNPSVTVAFAAVGQFPWSQVPAYVVAQFTSAILGSYIAKIVYGVEGELATTKPSAGWGRAFMAEVIASFFIMFLSSALSIDARAIGQLGGIAVGASIALGVLITAPISGGSMNPARSFGPAVVANDYEDIWVYLWAPTIGALGGALLYKFIRIHQ